MAAEEIALLRTRCENQRRRLIDQGWAVGHTAKVLMKIEDILRRGDTVDADMLPEVSAALDTCTLGRAD